MARKPSLVSQANRENSPTYTLARQFTEDILGDRWNPNAPRSRLLLAQARKLVNPLPSEGYDEQYDEMGRPVKPQPVCTVEQAMDAIDALTREMRRREPNWLPANLNVLFWQWLDGRTVLEYFTHPPVPPAPPQYDRLAFADWFSKYGQTVYGAEYETMRQRLNVTPTPWV